VVSTSAFVQSIFDFDSQLMSAKGRRIEQVEAGDLDANIRVDVAALRTEHLDRTRWLEAARSRQLDTNWQAVLADATVLEQEP
jgi:hypothetical protein